MRIPADGRRHLTLVGSCPHWDVCRWIRATFCVSPFLFFLRAFCTQAPLARAHPRKSFIPEFFTVEVVDDEVGGAVEADEEVRDADHHVDGRRHLAVVAELVATDDLVQV